MRNITKEEFDRRMDVLKERNLSIERRRELRRERFKYIPKIKLPTTSKLVLIVSAALCIEIVAFCQYVMLITLDLSALYAMIGVVASVVPVVLGYFMKSKAQNTKGGITYDMAMANKKEEENINYTADKEAVG